MAADTLETLKWSVRRRLEFIEFRLFWDGRVNRPAVAEEFGISSQQASADLALYQELAPANLTYDAAIRAYVRTPGFKPVLSIGSADRHLLQMVAIHRGWMTRQETWFDGTPLYDVVSLPRRPTDPLILLGLIDAIRGRREIGIEYQSMTGTTQTPRQVAPHALAHSAGRWYVRAWSREHNDFRDYNLNRIKNIVSSVASDIDYSFDYEWHQYIDMIIAPNPKLPENRQEAVANEYNMTEGRLVLPVRLSLSFYLMSEHNMDVEEGKLRPEKQQIVLVNKNEVEQARAMTHEMARQALNRAVATKIDKA